MNIFAEQAHDVEFLLAEGNGKISRDAIDVVKGDSLLAGQVLELGSDGVYQAYASPKTNSTDEGIKPKNGNNLRAGEGGKQLAILANAIGASDGKRHAVGFVRMAEIAGVLLTGLDDAATALFKTQFIIIR